MMPDIAVDADAWCVGALACGWPCWFEEGKRLKTKRPRIWLMVIYSSREVSVCEFSSSLAFDCRHLPLDARRPDFKTVTLHPSGG